jgi:hypothetical protein
MFSNMYRDLFLIVMIITQRCTEPQSNPDIRAKITTVKLAYLKVNQSTLTNTPHVPMPTKIKDKLTFV